MQLFSNLFIVAKGSRLVLFTSKRSFEIKNNYWQGVCVHAAIVLLIADMRLCCCNQELLLHTHKRTYTHME